MLALVPFDWQVHDTHFVVAHMHYVLVAGGNAFAVSGMRGERRVALLANTLGPLVPKSLSCAKIGTVRVSARPDP